MVRPVLEEVEMTHKKFNSEHMGINRDLESQKTRRQNEIYVFLNYMDEVGGLVFNAKKCTSQREEED